MRFEELPTPCYVADEGRLKDNLKILKKVQEDMGCRILLAQKAFSMFAEYPLLREGLAGTTASGLFEAKLGREEFGGEVHVFSPAYRDRDFDEIASICDHVIFNSLAQFDRYHARLKESSRGAASAGLRVNPMFSTQTDHAIYDPCAPGSRLGVTKEKLCAAVGDKLPEGIEGLHFHTLCEQNSDDLEATLDEVEKQFGMYFDQIKWLNMGGGHHITRPDYDIECLERCIRRIRDGYGLEVYLEPGEAVALNAGYFITEVLDIVENAGITTLILDGSAACHMPDVLEMPYRPPLRGSGQAGEKAFTCRLSANTCLAGDIIGDYSFDRMPEIGDRLVFEDMAIYSMVKNNTFNGIPLPAIAAMDESGDCRIIKEFGYEDFKGRLS